MVNDAPNKLQCVPRQLPQARDHGADGLTRVHPCYRKKCGRWSRVDSGGRWTVALLPQVRLRLKLPALSVPKRLDLFQLVGPINHRRRTVMPLPSPHDGLRHSHARPFRGPRVCTLSCFDSRPANHLRPWMALCKKRIELHDAPFQHVWENSRRSNGHTVTQMFTEKANDLT